MKNSRLITECQISGSKNLHSIMFLGYVPPVNTMQPIGARPQEQTMFPLELLYSPDSYLVQISCEVRPDILFPPEYPYRTGTTRILRENFANLFDQCKTLRLVDDSSFVIDIGSNDGTLLSNFKRNGCGVLGIEPTDQAELAVSQGIDTVKMFFSKENALKVKQKYGQANLVTAANVFAHMKDIDGVVEGIIQILHQKGVFISESHYLLDLIETLQYDTIYHEHLRYYSLHSLKFLLEKHGLEIFRVKRIPTHGGSIRVFAARKGEYPVDESVHLLLKKEKDFGLLDLYTYKTFALRAMQSKLDLLSLISEIKKQGHRIYGIGAPSRASTLITYTGLDNYMIDCVMEISGSHKIGKYMPGTLIPVRDEQYLYSEQPEYALLLSWHIGNEMIINLKKHGFKGKFIVPLPTPRIMME